MIVSSSALVSPAFTLKPGMVQSALLTLPAFSAARFFGAALAAALLVGLTLAAAFSVLARLLFAAADVAGMTGGVSRLGLARLAYLP